MKLTYNTTEIDKHIIGEDVEMILDMVYPSQVNLKSFEKKDVLNPKIWRPDGSLKKLIRRRLLEIAKECIEDLETLDLNGHISDILLVGSNAQYNYSKFSDMDLHIMIDFDALRDFADHDTLAAYLQMKKNEFNEKRKVTIYGYPVELYFQDISEENASDGVYSVLRDRWLKIPTKGGNVLQNRDLIKQQAAQYINAIDHIEVLAQKCTSKKRARQLKDEIKKIHDEIVQNRRDALNTKSGPKDEFAPANIVFKVLRRSGHLGKTNDIKRMLNDKIQSI